MRYPSLQFSLFLLIITICMRASCYTMSQVQLNRWKISLPERMTLSPVYYLHRIYQYAVEIECHILYVILPQLEMNPASAKRYFD